MAEVVFQINNNKSHFEIANCSSWQQNPSLSNDEKRCGEILLIANTKFCFLCTNCDERFESIETFIDHIKTMHLNENTLLNYPVKYEWDSTEQGDYEFTKSEPNDASGMVPESTNDKNEDKCSQLTISENEPVKDEPTKSLSCKKIIDLLPSPQKIPKRKREKKNHQCSQCNHIARNASFLESHIRRIHTKPLEHQCEECGKCFISRGRLTLHSNIHSGKRPFKCEFCNATFNHPNGLRYHRFLHTGNKPHKCNECEKSFVSSTILRNHMREHTGEKPYQCEICQKQFAAKNSFKRHMKGHTGVKDFACTLCDKAFIDRDKLKLHMVCHTNEKNFKCDVCEKRFSHRSNLMQHKKLHDSVKAYVCKICSKDFAQHIGLYQHLKIHNKK